MPPAVRDNVIIVGGLAAGYNFFSGDGAASMRTKDVDMLLLPHALAVDAAVEVTEALLASSWTQKADERSGQAGTQEDDTKNLPVVHLRPPASDDASAGWFLELLSAPPAYEAGTDGKNERRLHTCAGDFIVP